MDSDSPCKYLLFPRGHNLAQKPLYLVGTVLEVHDREYPRETEFPLWVMICFLLFLLRKFCRRTKRNEPNPLWLIILLGRLEVKSAQLSRRLEKLSNFPRHHAPQERLYNKISAHWVNDGTNDRHKVVKQGTTSIKFKFWGGALLVTFRVRFPPEVRPRT